MENTTEYDVIIIGAGAAGLMAANDLLQAGYKVCLLEAGESAGGRMATVMEAGFDQPVETGAEFVHGELPLTLALLRKAGISYLPVEGKMITAKDGELSIREDQDRYWDTMLKQLEKLPEDMSIHQFLQNYFPGEKYNDLRAAVTRYANGFDLAHTSNASAVAAAYEWNNEDETQYRIPGGYRQLAAYLLLPCSKVPDSLYLNTCVKSIEYNNDGAKAHTATGRVFEAKKLIVTVSAGMLQSGSIAFKPAIPTRYSDAIQQLGFGTVIKILLQFKNGFWREKFPDAGFLLSEEVIPTWWTQLSVKNNLLTGWLGGPPALARSNDSEAALLQVALKSLANIFTMSVEMISEQLQQHKIICWHNHPFVGGGYSYVTVGAAEAKKILAYPLEGSLFFAGEAMHRADAQGTVEAALQTGRETAKKIMAVLHSATNLM